MRPSPIKDHPGAWCTAERPEKIQECSTSTGARRPNGLQVVLRWVIVRAPPWQDRMTQNIATRIAAELKVETRQVEAAIELFDGGATVPFVARYRKEHTGGLDDTQLRFLEERLGYLRELEARRKTILDSIREQARLTPELEASILAAETRQRLEDLYLPYRPKRRTKAQIAREAGLDGLADTLVANPEQRPEDVAVGFLREPFVTEEGDNPGVADVKAALDGARQILMERLAEEAELLARLRSHLGAQALLVSRVVEGKETEGAKFRDYFAYAEPLHAIPSHRALALFRGRKEEFLRLQLRLPEEMDEANPPPPPGPCEGMIAAYAGFQQRGRPADVWLMETARWTWRVKLAWQLEGELLGELKTRADEEAIRVFARNLHDLLLAAPAGPRATMGLDPGIRTGVKLAIVDGTGKLVETTTLYPHPPRNDIEGALQTLSALARKHQVELVAIGNGTASRETDRLVAELLKREPDLRLARVVVSEAGASVYSASELAAREFPALDVSLRGAVSIARRLQDPLAELVKIEPRAIGVGQYQHDVSQTTLARSLDAVVEDCVNAVGIDLNTASVPLLGRVSGLSTTVAENIVRHRDQHGPFRSREALKAVPRLGPKTFEQAAGFLRVVGGDTPLDASAVHPEAYPLVEKLLADLRRPVTEVIGRSELLRDIDASRYVDETFGLPTVRDILKELEKPGRDPRPAFQMANFREGVEKISDLEPGMVLEGVVSNVANFGAFVDIGVHQDGLVHVSALSHRFVRDPREVVKAGDLVKVKVLEVDLQRQRIALSLRLDDEVIADAAREGAPSTGQRPRQGGDRRERAPASKTDHAPRKPTAPPKPAGSLASALQRALGEGGAKDR